MNIRAAATTAGIMASILALPACRSHTSTATAVAPKNPRPAAYRIVYHVEQPGSSDAERWEELTVRRPFEARDVTFAQRPGPGVAVDSGTLATVDHLYRLSPDGLQEIAGRQPGLPTGDQAIGPQLVEAQRRKLAAPTKTRRTIAGRQCQDHRFVEPPVGPIALLKGSDSDLLCIDDDGLLLREEWTLKGKVVLRRQAETVDLAPADLDRVLSPEGAAPFPANLAAPLVQPSDGSNPILPEPAPPAGFTKATIVDFALTGGQQAPGAPAALLYTSTVFAFARGGDSITVETGVSTGPLPWKDTDPSRDVELPWAKVQSVLRNDGPELRADLGRGRFIRVRGTVSPAALEAYARTLPHPL
jgi:hypothetical protein